MGGCNGPEGTLGPNGCNACQQVRSLSFCLKKCPDMMYDDNGVCKHCHENCLDGNALRLAMCNSCHSYLKKALCM